MRKAVSPCVMAILMIGLLFGFLIAGGADRSDASAAGGLVDDSADDDTVQGDDTGDDSADDTADDTEENADDDFGPKDVSQDESEYGDSCSF